MPTEKQQYDRLMNNILIKKLEEAAKKDKEDPTGQAGLEIDRFTHQLIDRCNGKTIYFEDTLTEEQINELIGPEHRRVLDDEIAQENDEIHLGGLCGHYEWASICKSNIGITMPHSLVRRKK